MSTISRIFAPNFKILKMANILQNSQKLQNPFCV